MLIPQFRQLVIARWNEIRDDQVESMIRMIRPMATFYQTCFERNFSEGGQGAANRHSWTAMANPNDGIWRNPNAIRNRNTYVEQMEYLVWWLEQRKIWMDGYMIWLNN